MNNAAAIDTPSESASHAQAAPGARRRLIRIAEVTELTSLPKASIYELIKAGEFPRSVLISAQVACWVEDEVAAWIDAKVAARDAVTR